MSFEPKILRVEDSATDRDVAGAALALSSSHPATGPDVHDTVTGLEMATLRDWRPDDDLLPDEELQLLARQLSEDAERLAARHPAVMPGENRFARRDGLGARRFYRIAAACLLFGLVAWSSGGNPPPMPAISAAPGHIRGELLAGERDSKSESKRARYRNGDESNWGAPLDSSGNGWEHALFAVPGYAGLLDDSEGFCDADDVPRMLFEQADAITRLEDAMRCRDQRIEQLEAEVAKLRPRDVVEQPVPASVPRKP